MENENDKPRIWSAIDSFRDNLSMLATKVSAVETAIDDAVRWSSRDDDRRHKTEDRLRSMEISIRGLEDSIKDQGKKLDVLEGLPLKIILGTGAFVSTSLGIAKLVQFLHDKMK